MAHMDVSNEDDKVVLKLNGRFDFNSYLEFRKHSQEFFKETGRHCLNIDFEGVTYMDSSALGMLLALKDTCDLSGKKIHLVNVKGVAADIFKIANFQKLFSIH